MIQRENAISLPGVADRDPGLLLELADRGGAERAVAVPLVAVDRPAGEHPGAAHEAGVRVALDEQDLERARAAAEQDHRAGGARDGALAEVQLLSGAGSIGAHDALPIVPHCPRATLAFLRVKWICGSCGFIYDPAEGDPDGGIPAGTAFEDIPETWFCPVCGARKRDFEPYDD